MTFAEWLLDQTIRLYTLKNKQQLNFSSLSKITNTRPAVVWRQINKGGGIRAEGFLRLFVALGNFRYLPEKNGILIKITDDPESIELVRKFCDGHFKGDYDETKTS